LHAQLPVVLAHPTSVALLDPRTTAVARTLFVFFIIGAFIYGARDTIVAFIFAIFFAYVFEPLVSRLQAWHAVSRGSRGIAIAEIYLILAMACAGIVLGAGPAIASEGRDLVHSAPVLFNKLVSGQIARQIGSSRGWSYETQLRIQHFLAHHRDAILSWVQQLGLKAGSLVTNAFWLALIPILAVFFLKEGRQIAEFGIQGMRLRPTARSYVRAAIRDVNDMAAHYIRAQLILAALSILAYTLVLALSGVQYGVILGVFAGILEFIPIVGPLVGAVGVLVIAYLTGFHYIWLLVLFFLGWRVLQDYVNSPLLMHRSVRLHPLAVIFAVLAGAEIAGIVGVYLSIPLAAALQIFWRRWQTYSDVVEENGEQSATRRAA
jgi:predicted PurR-regulated permease PerM